MCDSRPKLAEDGPETLHRVAWTPGPWSWNLDESITSEARPEPVLEPHTSGCLVCDDTDADLIVLAPEMGAAILEQARRYPDCDIVKELAAKLRRIGGDHA